MRLARVQGILTGPSLSPAQVFALSLMDMDERYDRARATAKGEMHSIRRAILSARPDLFEKLFPEYNTGKTDPEADASVERVEQDVPDEAISSDIENWIAQRGGVITADELGDDEGWQ